MASTTKRLKRQLPTKQCTSTKLSSPPSSLLLLSPLSFPCWVLSVILCFTITSVKHQADAFMSPTNTNFINLPLRSIQTSTSSVSSYPHINLRRTPPFSLELRAKGKKHQGEKSDNNEAGKPQNSNNAKSKKEKNKPQTSKKKNKGKAKPKPKLKPNEITNQKNKKKPQNKKKKTPQEILSLLSNPFQAGKKFRKSLDSALTTLGPGPGLSPEQRSIYYLDDRFLENTASTSTPNNPSLNALAFAERNPLFDNSAGASTSTSTNDEYIPEVLVIGATGAIGRLVVRRMVLSNKFRVRVLVRDLYSDTLNLLGAGVTYCQGDLRNVESLEYAVTDVDKIVFCAGPPRKDEVDFGQKFQEFVKETLTVSMDDDHEVQDEIEKANDIIDRDFQAMSDTMEVRARLAQQVDDLGMQNVVRAYQNVRYADYGTSQAAKRSLFKFQDREEDFNLFTINVDEDIVNVDVDADSDVDGNGSANANTNTRTPSKNFRDSDNSGDYDYDPYASDDFNPDDYADDTYGYPEAYPETSNNNAPKKKTKAVTTIQTQVNWMKNKFNHGVFVGKLPLAMNGVGSEASIISSRLRSREDPNMGTDLSNGFSGFVCRACADGKSYEFFIRTSEYETNGIEYVYKFDTETKLAKDGNKSLNKFQTIRIPFSKLVPTVRRNVKGAEYGALGEPFLGKDVKQIGFRVNSADNVLSDSDPNKKRYKWLNFYIALCYIKVYRSQPEPEFIYLSDARIPPKVKDGLVRHDLKRILTSDNEAEDGGSLFDEEEAKRVLENPKGRSGEELYYKYRGEEILKNSGLQYSIIRIPALNELTSGEFSTVQLKQTNDQLTPVSRAEVAEVCVSALLDPMAKNVCFYMTKAKPGSKKLSMDTTVQFDDLNPET